MKALPVLVFLLFFYSPAAPADGGGFARALAEAAKALDAGDLERTRAALDRALERDPDALSLWQLEETLAEKKDDKDARVYALHRELALARAQKADKPTLDGLKKRLDELDPVAADLAKLRTNFVDKLTALASGYEKAKRPHSAIRAYKEALALDPDRAELQTNIERLAASPDPSLAEDARPRDLLEGVSADWIAKFNAKHLEWSDKAVLEKPNYVTQTDAGYEVLVRTGEAMEQMNAFYRIFFHYGAEGDKRQPSRIFVNIFKKRDEYTKDPKDWSGGHFTGDSVETYIAGGGFESMTQVLFHEAAHQFVSLATQADGWLNEGLACFFEGTRILSNGTVLFNLPANGYLFSLTERMDRGWMSGPHDGIDPNEATVEPKTAPTFRTVLEGEYEWAPPWYAPAWGFVFFCYNFQDPVDGRFVYRKSFWNFVAASGGKMGKTAVATFEETVLANPAPVTLGLTSKLALPKTVDELNEVWKTYLFSLRDQQSGRDGNAPPYVDWAHNAIKRGEIDDAGELYEKALAATPRDPSLLTEYGEYLANRKKEDRATKLLSQAASEVELKQPLDKALLERVERGLRKVDPTYQRLDDVRNALVTDARAVIDRYLAENLNLMAMDVSFHLGSELAEPTLYAGYEKALAKVGHSLARWKLAYNEESLAGWNAAGLENVFKPNGETLDVQFGEYKDKNYDFNMLTLDQITSGDYSMEAEVEVQRGQGMFAGLVFGKKGDSDCHALILFPPAASENGSLDLATFHGGGSPTPMRRTPVTPPGGAKIAAPNQTVAASMPRAFYKLRIDVTGRLVDVWLNDGYQCTQEFAGPNVLRGKFGLITGVGHARFKNVRFLARHPRDPSAGIERKLTVGAKLESGQSNNGSWLGLVPPFPAAKLWYQEPRTSWAEARGSPQLLVMWSKDQNDKIQIDSYLRALEDQHRDVGLRIVNVLAFWDEELAESYLKDHHFPGSVALDTPTEAAKNFGVTFERFEVQKFHLPRFILLDIDGKVVWEGDPGFVIGEAWSGGESLLDVPLRELIVKRKLPEFAAWRKTWPAAREALARGEFEKAAAALKAAADFDPAASDEVAEADRCRTALESALNGADALCAQLTADGREPALEALSSWAEALGKPIKKTKAFTTTLKSPSLAAWKRVPGMLKPALAKIGKDDAAVEDALSKVAALPGAFPAELAERARAVASDKGAFEALVNETAVLPARWLADKHFGW